MARRPRHFSCSPRPFTTILLTGSCRAYKNSSILSIDRRKNLLGVRATYVYDADGNRVEKISPPNSEDSEVNKIYLYDQSGHPIQQFTAAFWQGHIFAGSRHLATVGGGYTVFSHSEWLGTERLRTYYNGSVCESIASLPFGDGQTTTGACYHPSPLHFTGKERDPESGLDNFGARYNTSSMGRFMSPDETLVDQEPEYPQSWNLYTYVRNNPLINIDEDGRECSRDNSGNFHGDCSSPGDEKVTQADKPQQFSVNADAWAHFWGDRAYHQLEQKQFEEWSKKNGIKVVRAEIPIGPGEIENLAKLAEELLLSKNSLKHILKHLPEFKKFDPQITIKEVVQIGEDVIKTGTQMKSNTWVKTVIIGGKQVVVRAAVNANNMLRTVFPH